MTTSKLYTNIGATVGFILFMAIGLVPGFLYGGYAGLILAHGLGAVDASLVVRVMVSFGMVLGLIALFSLFTDRKSVV
jgi:hypothetical protein